MLFNILHSLNSIYKLSDKLSLKKIKELCKNILKTYKINIIFYTKTWKLKIVTFVATFISVIAPHTRMLVKKTFGM